MSEFGKGLTYCLGLFLAHAERDMFNGSEAEGVGHKLEPMLWFNGAADHLYDLQIPETLPAQLQADLAQFQDKCLHWRLYDATEDDKKWAIKTAKDFLFQIDKHFGIPVQKGDYE